MTNKLNIGVSYAGVTLDSIFDNAAFYSDQLKKQKVIAFREIDLSIDGHHALINALSSGVVPEKTNSQQSKDLREQATTDHGETFTLYAKEDMSTGGSGGYVIPHRNHHRQERGLVYGDPFEFFKWSVHIDTPQDPDNPIDFLQEYTSMHMHHFKYPENVGRTKFLSLVDLYDRCPMHFKEKLFGRKIKEYKNSGTLHLGTWDALVVHPETHEKILFWPSWYVGLDSGDEPWFDELIEWVRTYMLDENNWFIWSWRENDFVMFDNRALVHSFEGGWDSENRIFSQGGIGSEVLQRVTAL
jgi:hypothetical protein